MAKQNCYIQFTGNHNQESQFTTSKMRKNSIARGSEIVAITGEFVEFDEFAEVAAAWDLDFRQIGKGRLNATLMQAFCESWFLGKARFDRPAYQQGIAVPGMRTFAILDSAAPDTEWCGRPIVGDIIAAFAKDGGFESISPPGFDVYTLSFTEEQLSAACERLGIPDISTRLSATAEIWQVGPGQSSVLRHLVDYSLRTLCFSDPPRSGWTASDHLRDDISEHLVLLLGAGSPLIRTPSQRARSLAINCALEAIETGLKDRISVREVIEASGISRRTLEYAFRDRFGISPKAFINSQRLVCVRRDLRTRPNEIPITDIANHWGFWHMGQFARDYQRQFGELPSRTRR
jgi:AraC family transcriptional regulator, ethanolamine operon transcriptional activator